MSSIPWSLFSRESGISSPKTFSARYYYEPLRHLDTTSHRQHKFCEGKIVEIIPTPSLLFIISSLNKAYFINKQSFHTIKELTHIEERSRTIFFNKCSNKIILVVSKVFQNTDRLICRSFDLISLENGDIHEEELFKCEDLRNPGFIEFDEVNKLVLTRSASTLDFKFWSLEDYSLLFTLSDPLIEEIRLTTELIMIIYSPQTEFIICKLCSASTGKLLDIIQIALKPFRSIELIELFNTHFLIKQFGEPLIMINLLDKTLKRLEGFSSPQNFIFLNENNIFLALRSSIIELWDFNGKLLKIYGAPMIFENESRVPNRIFISKNQDVILLLCFERVRNVGTSLRGYMQKSSIRIFKLIEGELIKEIKDHRVLDNLTTATYDEYFGVLFTGHSDGSVTWWGN